MNNPSQNRIKQTKNIIIIASTGAFLLCFLIWGILSPDLKTSESERRTLMSFPELSAKTLLNGKFMTDFESYSMDQFPLRDEFRSAKAFSNFYLLGLRDMNGIYVKDGYVSKLEYPLDESSLDYASQKFQYIYTKYLTNSQVYLAIIPDKNYFLAKEAGYPAMDYDTLTAYMKEKNSNMTYIDLWDTLELSDYYKTDTHWKQEKLLDTAKKLSDEMENPIFTEDEITGKNSGTVFEQKTLDQPFYGVYYGQSALPLKPEKIVYYTNDVIENCEIFDYETNQKMPMYDMIKGHGKDPYEMFLSGSKSLIKITNPSATSGKKLVIFRDSFGSSIAPLLTGGYEEIILVDTRYLQPDFIGKFIDFENEDYEVLFLYSTLILNNSVTLK